MPSWSPAVRAAALMLLVFAMSICGVMCANEVRSLGLLLTACRQDVHLQLLWPCDCRLCVAMPTIAFAARLCCCIKCHSFPRHTRAATCASASSAIVLVVRLNDLHRLTQDETLDPTRTSSRQLLSTKAHRHKLHRVSQAPTQCDQYAYVHVQWYVCAYI